MTWDFTIIKEAILQFDFGLQGLLVGVILVGISAIVITRDTRNLRLLIFPLALGFNEIGIQIPDAIVALTGVMWAVTLVGAHIIGSTISGIGGATVSATRSIVRSPYTAGKWGVGKYKGTEKYKIKKENKKILQQMAFAEGTKDNRLLKSLQQAGMQDVKEAKLLPLRKKKALREGVFSRNISSMWDKRKEGIRRGIYNRETERKFEKIRKQRELKNTKNVFGIMDFGKSKQAQKNAPKYIPQFAKDTYNYKTEQNKKAIKAMFRANPKQKRTFDQRAFNYGMKRVYNPIMKRLPLENKFQKDIQILRYLKKNKK